MKEIIKLLHGINNCPIPVIIEYPDGQEFPIIKAYEITGRTASIKILVDCKREQKEHQDKVSNLEDSIVILESENEDLQDSKDELESELEDWTDAFGDDVESFKTLQNGIEESVAQFANIVGLRLQANDAKNIEALQKIHESTTADLKTADEIIKELKEGVALLKELLLTSHASLKTN